MEMEKYLNNIFKEVDASIKIDEEQREVILDDSDNLIVVAGAGSGKTTTIAGKIKYLVDIKKVKPKEILIISLTNKAIDELKNRINVEFGIDAKICTFHKLAYDMLKMEDIRYRINTDFEKITKEIIKKNKDTNTIIKFLRKDKTYKMMDDKTLNSFDTLTNFTMNNIKMIKALNVNIKKIKTTNKITLKYIEYLEEIMNEYNKKMKDNYELDYDDLILKASTLKNIKLNYKYIFVDEYQDISMNRFILLKNIIEKINPKTIVVGDDFQTIFSFAGSNIDLFINFQKEMNAKLLKITNTYRNSQQLIDTAGSFVMKNTEQIKKELYSTKSLNYPIKIYGYKNDFNEKFLIILDRLISSYGEQKNILILGRYKDDILKIRSRKLIVKEEKIIYMKYPNTIIRFMTIHSSKGLGYDNIIIINFSNDYRGFPSNIKNNNIYNDIFHTSYNQNEERRLFYVALTRTKNEVNILTPIKNESIFLNDIYDDPNVLLDYKFKLIKSNSRHKI